MDQVGQGDQCQRKKKTSVNTDYYLWILYQEMNGKGWSRLGLLVTLAYGPKRWLRGPKRRLRGTNLWCLWAAPNRINVLIVWRLSWQRHRRAIVGWWFIFFFWLCLFQGVRIDKLTTNDWCSWQINCEIKSATCIQSLQRKKKSIIKK